MDKICIHVFVSGRVQGVYFRAHTFDEATKLGLMGWVKNCSDGRVEVMACGPRVSVQKLLDWLNKGPPAASVNQLNFEECKWQEFSEFGIIH